MAQIYFYSQFKHFQIRLIANSFPKEADKFKTKIEFIKLGLKPFYGFDPFSLKGVNHRSWVGFDGLEKCLKDVKVIETLTSFYFYSRQAAILAEKLHKPLVVSIWEINPFHPATWLPPYCFNVRKVLRQGDLFILKSKKSGEFLDRFKIEEKRRKQIYMGIDLKLFKPGKGGGGSRILYVGRLVKSKGVEDLIEAFRILSMRRRETELWLVGEGPLKERLKKLTRGLPVKVLGRLSYKKMPALYQKADLVCLPSKTGRYFGLIKREEMFPYVGMEAMASGLAVVGTRTGGIPEAVGPANTLVKAGDIKALVKGIEKFLSNKVLRRKTGMLNRKFALKNYDLKRQARKTEEAILALLSAPKREEVKKTP